MELALMRYKGFTFWCNPFSIEVLSEASTANYSLPYSGQQYEDLGKKCRVIKGKGEIRGTDCLKQYAELYALQSKGGKGVLSLPHIKPFEALFTSLSATADESPDKISYSFTFTEVSSEDKNTFEKIHIVSDDETLFDIAYKYATDVDTLVKLNPKVRRPDELLNGWEIKICSV